MTQYLLNNISVDNIEWICQKCEKYLKKNKLPHCSVKVGMILPEIPDHLDLNELGWRLVAPKIAFQKQMKDPRGK